MDRDPVVTEEYRDTEGLLRLQNRSDSRHDRIGTHLYLDAHMEGIRTDEILTGLPRKG